MPTLILLAEQITSHTAAPSAAADASLTLAMLIVFGSAKLFGSIFERLGQPGIVGQIVAGVVIGPAVLHWIEPNLLLHALAELGVIFLLFRIGLEVRTSELWRVGVTALAVASLGVVLPFLCGWALMRGFGAPNAESLFVGVALVATSVGITAEVLASKGWLEERASKIILAAAVIDDVLGLIALALVTNLAQGKVDWLGLASTTAVAVAFTVLVATFGARAARQIVPELEHRLQIGEAQFNIALVVLFALAFLAAKAGVAAIIGAFLAGITMAETVDQRVDDLAHGVTEFLLPFFLTGIGLNLDLHSLANPRSLLLTAVVILVAVLSKIAGCGAAVATSGWREVLRVGIGMVPRGEVGMVVAQIGLAMHVIRQDVYAVVVTMAIATTMLAPPLLNVVFRGARPVLPAHEEFSLN